MTEVERIANQLDRALQGEAWHGPAVLELLKEVTAEQAAVHAVGGCHSIWELTLHIDAWLRAVRQRLKGDPAQLTDAEDWPAITSTTQQAWANTQEALKRSHAELRSSILQLGDAQLDEPIIAGMSSTYVNLHGVVQHTLYHAGQIAILKKVISEAQTK